MLKQENELKAIISAKEYARLCEFLDFLMIRTGPQTNYYYDTSDGIMRKANTTVRVRQKGNQLKGTIKRHLSDGCSTEESFSIDALPRVIMVDGIPVWLKGSLTTERTVYQVFDEVKIMLDLNQYLGVVDHEIEIEFPKYLHKQAEWLMNSLLGLLKSDIDRSVVSKSERFFRVLEQRGGDPYG